MSNHETRDAALKNRRTAPMGPELGAALGFLKELTLATAIEDAIQGCTVSNRIDRVADTLGFQVPEPESLFSRGRHALEAGPESEAFP